MKRIKLFPLALVSVLGVSVLTGVGIKSIAADAESCYVDFFNNYKRQDFTLSSGFVGTGNSLLYTTVTVTKGSLVSKPQDPERKNYDFKGWFKEATHENEWDFSTMTVEGNTRLYAYWELSEGGEIVEPPYTPPSTVLPESSSVDYEIYSVMYSVPSAGVVDLTTAAIAKLENSKDNVLPYIEYKVKASKTITATYDAGEITIICGGDVETLTVNDVTAAKAVPATYESKAVNYEKKALEEENYHVMLAGSSSIEFWETSKEDLDPIVSYNHGIGGTTIEQWDTCLNQRLVYPAKPKMVVYYVGINNVINSNETAPVISQRLKDFFDHTHEALPNTKIVYILMNLLPGFKNKTNIINTVNQAIRDYQVGKSWLLLTNPGEALLKASGEPSAAYFRTDGLHLSYYGYVLWGSVIKRSILEGLENM